MNLSDLFNRIEGNLRNLADLFNKIEEICEI